MRSREGIVDLTIDSLEISDFLRTTVKVSSECKSCGKKYQSQRRIPKIFGFGYNDISEGGDCQECGSSCDVTSIQEIG